MMPLLEMLLLFCDDLDIAPTLLLYFFFTLLFYFVDISIEILQRGSFTDVLSVWRTYKNIYPACEPSLMDIAASGTDTSDEGQAVDIDTDKELWLIVSVVDKGIGIDAAGLQRIGTAFTQLSQGRQKKYQGTGLGINICNMIVTALRGKLVIFSTPGFGSCFTFAVPVKMEEVKRKGDLPAQPVADVKNERKLRRKKLQAQFEELGIAARKPKVMVVDDSSINRKLCRRKIKSLLPDIAIAECSSGQALVEEYEHDHSIIMGVFLDFHMHGMDGDVATRIIREFESTHEDARRVYIAGYTADVLDDSTNSLLAAGMDSVLPKPEPQEAFEKELRNMMMRFASGLSATERTTRTT